MADRAGRVESAGTIWAGTAEDGNRHCPRLHQPSMFTAGRRVDLYHPDFSGPDADPFDSGDRKVR